MSPPQVTLRWSEVRKPLVWRICNTRPGRSRKVDQRDEYGEAKLLEGKTDKDRVRWGRRKRDESMRNRMRAMLIGGVSLNGVPSRSWEGPDQAIKRWGGGEGNGELPRHSRVWDLCAAKKHRSCHWSQTKKIRQGPFHTRTPRWAASCCLLCRCSESKCSLRDRESPDIS